jgi:hypothetical protein
MELADLKKRLQGHLTDGLVTIVGSGLSMAEGIPGMLDLAKHLVVTLPSKVPPHSVLAWEKIKEELESGTDLENALLKHQPDQSLEILIGEATAELISPAEALVFEEAISGERTLRFSRLCNHLLKPATGIPVITTNYDRLIELAAELCGLGVDTLFVGHRAGRLNGKESRFGHCRGIVERKVDGKRKPTLDYAPHVRVMKPHGSLDWYRGLHGPVACSQTLGRQRLIITPGLNKYRGGYDMPFDAHREAANREIDRASRFLIVGYGFNDEHLQTHLQPKLMDGKPAVVLTRTLSPNVAQLLEKCPGMVALARSESDTGTVASTPSGTYFYPNAHIWDLGHFVDEVLTP